jgi:Ni/Co efflux regulator RcnB
MKRAALAAIVLPLILSWGSVALADSRHDRHDARRAHPSYHDHRHGHDRHTDRHTHYRHPVPRYHPPHGYRPHHWRRGDRLPRAYYARPYIIHDYHVYHLHHPPRGYHWVRVDRDVVLAAIATGVILDVVYNHF